MTEEKYRHNGIGKRRKAEMKQLCGNYEQADTYEESERNTSGHGEGIILVIRLEEEDRSDLAIAELRDNRVEILLGHLSLTTFLYGLAK